jgi:hypothetical protein
VTTVASAYRFDWDVPIPESSVAAPPVENKGTRWVSKVFWWMPVTRPAPNPTTPRTQMSDLTRWTRLSNRGLADLLGTTHPTIAAIARGQTSSFARRPDLGQRLAGIHALCRRLAPALGADARSLVTLLETPTADGRTIAELAASGDLAGAYLLSMQLVAPATWRDGFAAGLLPAPAGRLTSALEDPQPTR